jgi:hypothetical protein
MNLIIDKLPTAEASPHELGTWLTLMMFCCQNENGGRIEGARTWTPKQWYTNGLDPIDAESQLWTWDGNDLIVGYYPMKSERRAKASRSNGCKGGRPKKNLAQNLDQNLGNNLGGNLDNNLAQNLDSAVAMGETIEGVSNKTVVSNNSVNQPNLTPIEKENNIKEKESPLPFPIPQSAEEVQSYLESLPEHPQDTRRCAVQYFMRMANANWTTKSGEPITNWTHHVKLFAERWIQYESPKRTTPTSASVRTGHDGMKIQWL